MTTLTEVRRASCAYARGVREMRTQPADDDLRRRVASLRHEYMILRATRAVELASLQVPDASDVERVGLAASLILSGES
jgi:hypothetical protein